MNFSDYQKEAVKTAVYPDRHNNFIYPTLGLVDEAGEVAGKIKKLVRDQNKLRPADLVDVDRQELKKEIGDVVWYAAVLADELGVSFQDIAETNIEKLCSRQERNQLHGSGDNR